MYKIVVASILFIISIFISINLITPKPAARLNTMFNSLFYGSTEVNDSNNVRLLVWSASIDIIKKEPFTGVGTGDVKNSLRIRNIESGNHHLAEKEYNSHNQFLNTGVALGIPGLIILIVIIVLCLKYMNRNLKPVWIYNLILFSIIFFMFTESALERQAGIVFFTFLICGLGSGGLVQSNLKD